MKTLAAVNVATFKYFIWTYAWTFDHNKYLKPKANSDLVCFVDCYEDSSGQSWWDTSTAAIWENPDAC